jgi:hypothetical protein
VIPIQRFALPRLSFTLALCLATATPALAQKPTSNGKSADPTATVPKLAPLVARSTSDFAPVVERYTADQQSLARRYDANDSPEQRQRMRSFATAWRARLRELDFDRLNHEGRADYVLLDNHLKHQIAVLDRDDRKRNETTSLLPFSDRLLALQDTRRDLVPVDPAAAARTLAQVTRAVDSMRALFEPAPTRARPQATVPHVLAQRRPTASESRARPRRRSRARSPIEPPRTSTRCAGS